MNKFLTSRAEFLLRLVMSKMHYFSNKFSKIAALNAP